MEANLRDIVIKLDVKDIQQILSIEMDNDRDSALLFIKKILSKKVKEALRSHCVPVFEASYKPGQKDVFYKINL